MFDSQICVSWFENRGKKKPEDNIGGIQTSGEHMTPFRPNRLPPEDLDWGGLVGRISEASAALARYDALLQTVVNPQMLLVPLLNREAVLSSRIEGTQASLDDVLEHEAAPSDVEPAKHADIREVINYREAVRLAVERMEERPISLNLVREVHGILMDSVRGHDKGRGDFRRTQNWIGPHGTTQAEATYMPPPPQEVLPLLDNLEKYIHTEERDAIVQVGLVHAQFELIHPFLDGNGRVGRMLIPLILYDKGRISRPAFYMSGYLERHRKEYYRRLQEISDSGSYQGWLAFFLRAVIEQATEDTARLKGMLDLYESMKQTLTGEIRTQYAIPVLDTLFAWPLFSTPQFSERSKVPHASAARLLKELEANGRLTVLRQGRGRRATIWMFPELLQFVR